MVLEKYFSRTFSFIKCSNISMVWWPGHPEYTYYWHIISYYIISFHTIQLPLRKCAGTTTCMSPRPLWAPRDLQDRVHLTLHTATRFFPATNWTNASSYKLYKPRPRNNLASGLTFEEAKAELNPAWGHDHFSNCCKAAMAIDAHWGRLWPRDTMFCHARLQGPKTRSGRIELFNPRRVTLNIVIQWSCYIELM